MITRHATYYARNREKCLAASKARYQTIKHAIAQAAKAARTSALSQRRLARSLQAYTDRLQSAQHLHMAELRSYVNILKSSTPCLDCRQTFPACVMDFDHVRGSKLADISHILSHISNYSRQILLTELSKCELVCANCHRIRTAFRQFGIAE
jgi:hypothetical protein